MTPDPRSTLLRYGSAVAAVFLATMARVALDPALGDRFPFATMFLAVLVVGAYAGQGPALVTTVLGAIALARFLLLPRGSFAVHRFEDRAGLVLYLVIGVGIALVGGALGGDRRRAMRNADEALRQREQMLITLLSIGEAVIVTDAEGRVMSLNAIAEALTGWSVAEAVGQPAALILRVVNEETHQEVVAPALPALREEMVVNLAKHAVLIGRDGTERPIEDSAAPIRDASGRIVGTVLVFRDVSAKERAEAEVRRAGDQARTILESITDAFLALDRDWRFTYINRHCEVLMGRPGAEQIGKNYWEEYPSAVGTAIEENFRRAVAENVAVSFEVFVEAHGRWYDSRAYPSPQGLSVYFQDVTERKRSQEEHDRLAEASERQRRIYETALSNTTDFHYIFDLEGHVTYANNSLLELWRKGASEVLGKHLGDLGITPDLAAHLQSQVRRTIEARQPVRDETPYTNHLGERLYEYIFVPVLGAGGEVESVAGSTRDITDRKRAEEREWRLLEEAATANAQFRAFFEQGALFAGILSLDGTIIEVNRLALEACGYTREEVMGRPFWECPWWSLSAALAERIREATALAAAGGTFRAELPYFVADGGERVVEFVLVPITDEAGRVLFLAPTGTDITDRKRAEERVRFQAHLLDTVGQAVVVTDPHGRITYWNRFAETLYGWAADEAIGRKIHELIVADDMATRAAEIMARLGAGEGWSGEFLVSRRDGTAFPVFVTDTPVFDEAGALAAIIGVSMDNTERSRAEVVLKEADRCKNEFLATLAHELRNPLAPIRNALHLMRSPDGNGEMEAERAMAERQVVHLARLIDDLMDVARISRGKIELHREVVDLGTIVSQAVETARPQIEERRHELTVSLPDELIRLEGDPTRLEQVLWNLLNNAAKYSEPGGRMGLTVVRDGGEVVLRVRDAGIGIAAEALPHIFEMFVQVVEHRGHAQGGLGIGLSLVRTLVEMHGGSITARSEGPGKGSEFVVRLPVLPSAHVKENAAPDPRKGLGHALPRRRILVVDDNVDAATTMAKLLERIYGQDVRVAHDGPRALSSAEEFRPEVILLDIGLPGMDGNEVATRLRQRPEFATTLIVALTGWGQDSDVERSQAAGFDHHLVKPANPEAIVELLARSGKG